jgi:hypothetical protein
MKMRLDRSILLASAAVASMTLGIGAMTSKTKGEPRVILFLSTDCPIAAGYTPRINALFDRYAAKGVEFEAEYPNDLETRPAIDTYMSERSYKFPYELDLGAQLAKKLHVNTVPTAVVLDSSGNEVYRGAIDDNGDPTLARKHYLDDALAAVVDGKKPSLPFTSAVGCIIMPSKAAPSPRAVNYAANIKEILDKHCVQCHVPGEVAPFSLKGYVNAKKWAPMIARVTEARQMPPWKAVHGFGEFSEDNSLSETEIETLQNWNEAGAPKGPLGKEDLTVKPIPEWRLGKPDMIIEPSKPYHLAADGGDVYRDFVFHTHFDHPMYVRGFDVEPGNRRVVHHALVYTDITHYSDKLAEKQNDGQDGFTVAGGGPGFFPDTTLGGWAPGGTPHYSPGGYGFRLKAGANVVLQVHYHKDGKPEDDLTRVALYFTKEPPAKVMEITWVVNPRIDIPAGADNHAEHFTFNINHDTTIYAVAPHMHLTGKSMKATVVFPDGSTKPLIYVKDWDFHWQFSYLLKTPMLVPKGSHIDVEAIYDNSANNPTNPNSPPKELTWGEQTTDEMMVMVMATTREDTKVQK